MGTTAPELPLTRGFVPLCRPQTFLGDSSHSDFRVRRSVPFARNSAMSRLIVRLLTPSTEARSATRTEAFWASASETTVLFARSRCSQSPSPRALTPSTSPVQNRCQPTHAPSGLSVSAGPPAARSESSADSPRRSECARPHRSKPYRPPQPRDQSDFSTAACATSQIGMQRRRGPMPATLDRNTTKQCGRRARLHWQEERHHQRTLPGSDEATRLHCRVGSKRKGHRQHCVDRPIFSNKQKTIQVNDGGSPLLALHLDLSQDPSNLRLA